jgi:hypothetical protein
MAKSGAERQAAYRRRRRREGDGGSSQRLNLWVSFTTHFALMRLAKRYGVTMQEMMERLIVMEDERIKAGMALRSPEWDAYFNVE